MKTLKRIGYVLFYGGIFLGTAGQFIWAFIFWNSELFIQHWTIAFIGLGMVILGVFAPARDLTTYILYK